jgi:hypothetical protein
MRGTRPDLCDHCLLNGEVHIIEVCAECGWPPAGDGRCYCETHGSPPDGQWPDYRGYMTENRDRLRALKGLGPRPRDN